MENMKWGERDIHNNIQEKFQEEEEKNWAKALF